MVMSIRSRVSVPILTTSPGQGGRAWGEALCANKSLSLDLIALLCSASHGYIEACPTGGRWVWLMCLLACVMCSKELYQRVHCYGIGRFLVVVAMVVFYNGLTFTGVAEDVVRDDVGAARRTLVG